MSTTDDGDLMLAERIAAIRDELTEHGVYMTPRRIERRLRRQRKRQRERRTISYADPTGEAACWNLRGRGGWR